MVNYTDYTENLMLKKRIADTAEKAGISADDLITRMLDDWDNPERADLREIKEKINTMNNNIMFTLWNIESAALHAAVR
jgi:hypothetical protein